MFPLPQLGSLRRSRVPAVLGLTAGLFALPAAAQVIEPNGVTAPQPAPADEISIQAYFDAEMEAIDAVADASAEPGAFSPLCDFTATIVLAEASGADGLAWYNVPATPTGAPATLYPIIPESTRVTGQIFTGSDIRNDPNYTGGLIGFALTQNGGTPIYYSEYQRNANCTECSMPGHWKMMLAYRSVLRQNAYYLGFEDWAGADEASWGDNDGDFQDKMFLVTGVTCAGGGEPCDTGMPGLCAAGLTECAVNGAPTCKQQQMPRTETCDNADNDCNGLVDDGELCDADFVCVRGKCVARCNTGEFACPPELVCGADGYCIDPACRDVTCAAGLACRNGTCVGVCEGVVCPIDQVCQHDRCIDPCGGVTCPAMTFCQRGVCVGECACNGCPEGQECAPDGRCVAPGCAGVPCAPTEACRAGACVPRCDGAVCPGGAVCSNGACADAPTGGTAGTAGTSGTAGAGGTIIVNGGTGAGPATGGAGASGGTAGIVTTGGSGGSGGDGLGTNEPSESSRGCACRTPPRSERNQAPLYVALAVFGAGFARRRTRARPSP
jgi:hypothetical protein